MILVTSTFYLLEGDCSFATQWLCYERPKIQKLRSRDWTANNRNSCNSTNSSSSCNRIIAIPIGIALIGMDLGLSADNQIVKP